VHDVPDVVEATKTLKVCKGSVTGTLCFTIDMEKESGGLRLSEFDQPYEGLSAFYIDFPDDDGEGPPWVISWSTRLNVEMKLRGWVVGDTDGWSDDPLSL
jgi:hypothetical protein